MQTARLLKAAVTPEVRRVTFSPLPSPRPTSTHIRGPPLPPIRYHLCPRRSTKPVKLSSKLATILGAEQLTRPQVTSAL